MQGMVVFKRRGSKFSQENISALMRAIEEGITVEELIERSGADITEYDVKRWLAAGRQNIMKNQNTVVANFTKVLDEYFIGFAGESRESARRRELDMALEILDDESQDDFFVGNEIAAVLK